MHLRQNIRPKSFEKSFNRSSSFSHGFMQVFKFMHVLAISLVDMIINLKTFLQTLKASLEFNELDKELPFSNSAGGKSKSDKDAQIEADRKLALELSNQSPEEDPTPSKGKNRKRKGEEPSIVFDLDYHEKRAERKVQSRLSKLGFQISIS